MIRKWDPPWLIELKKKWAKEEREIKMRTFILDRKSDITGISGTGIIAYGVEWLPDGPCDLFWLGTNTTGQYPDILSIKAIHCYNDNAKIVYLEANHFVAGSTDRVEVEDPTDMAKLDAYEEGIKYAVENATNDA